MSLDKSQLSEKESTMLKLSKLLTSHSLLPMALHSLETPLQWSFRPTTLTLAFRLSSGVAISTWMFADSSSSRLHATWQHLLSFSLVTALRLNLFWTPFSLSTSTSSWMFWEPSLLDQLAPLKASPPITQVTMSWLVLCIVKSSVSLLSWPWSWWSLCSVAQASSIWPMMHLLRLPRILMLAETRWLTSPWSSTPSFSFKSLT